jgi:hypothetical protein
VAGGGWLTPARQGGISPKKSLDFQRDLPYHTVMPVGAEKSPAGLDILIGML